MKRREIVSDEVVDGSDCSSLEYDEVTPESLQLTHQTQMPNLHTVSVARPHKVTLTHTVIDDYIVLFIIHC